MRNIAIVEDDEGAAEALATLLRRYEKERGGGNSFNLVRYRDAETFLSAYDSGFEIVLMDIELPDMNGMEASRRLRERDADVIIIFVTNMAQYAIKGYEVRAFDFIVKPVVYADFALKLTGALECADKRRGKTVWISNKEGRTALRTTDIKYVEVVQHMLIWHTVSGDFRASGQLSDAEAMLRGEPFAYCNRCYYVNLRFVTAVRGYDEGFRLALVSGGEAQLYDSVGDRWLQSGADLFERCLHIENAAAAYYVTDADWELEAAGNRRYIELESLEPFIATLLASPMQDWGPGGENGDIYEYGYAEAHLYLEMADGTAVQLRLFENGCVKYDGSAARVCAYMPGAIFDEVFAACG